MNESRFIPYGRQVLDEEDIQAVVEVLKSDWLTSGPTVNRFEEAVKEYCGVSHGVAVSSGTAALHCAMYALGVGPGDEVIVPSFTFAASANAVLYVGATPVFVDIHPKDLLIDVEKIEAAITPRTKAIVAVDYAGQPCDYGRLRQIAKGHGLFLVADACHSFGGSQGGKSVGSLADITTLSFHPVKHITTGEGGMLLTDHEPFAKRALLFRGHGISSDHRERARTGALKYEMVDLGFNYRLTDIQCALGISQLRKMSSWVKIRNEIADFYRQALTPFKELSFVAQNPGLVHAYHLFVIQLDFTKMKMSRDHLAVHLKSRGIGVNAHYPPCHLHPYYRKRFGYGEGLLPETERAYSKVLSLPIFPSLREEELSKVVRELKEALF